MLVEKQFELFGTDKTRAKAKTAGHDPDAKFTAKVPVVEGLGYEKAANVDPQDLAEWIDDCLGLWKCKTVKDFALRVEKHLADRYRQTRRPDSPDKMPKTAALQWFLYKASEELRQQVIQAGQGTPEANTLINNAYASS